MRAAPAAAPWPLDKIQGFLLRGYRANFARHFALTLAQGPKAAASARAFLLGLADPAAGGLALTTAQPWGADKPDYCLNVGFTYRGLAGLGVPAASLAVFASNPHYQPFTTGAYARATATPGLNQVGASAPANWLVDDKKFDILLSLWTDDDAVRDRVTETLRALAPGTFLPLADDRIFDGHALDSNAVYFGFADNISQPIIAGSPFPRPPDSQDAVDPSAFMIGTGSGIYGAAQMNPPRFGQYGCFGAFLMIKQEVEAFEAQVETVAPLMGAAFGITNAVVQEHAVKASMCGRWPNGTSLAVHPIDGNCLPPDPQDATSNAFRYVLSDGTADQGSVCPVGSHMRRGNMRLRAKDAPFPGGGFPGAPSSSHRIMRRAMPYQIPYRPEDRDDPGTERGLVGLFLGASLMEQFELVFGQWINATFFTDLQLSDCVIGAPPPLDLSIPSEAQSTIGSNLQSCVATRAMAYVYYPGVDGVRFVAGA